MYLNSLVTEVNTKDAVSLLSEAAYVKSIWCWWICRASGEAIFKHEVFGPPALNLNKLNIPDVSICRANLYKRLKFPLASSLCIQWDRELWKQNNHMRIKTDKFLSYACCSTVIKIQDGLELSGLIRGCNLLIMALLVTDGFFQHGFMYIYFILQFVILLLS